MIGMRRSVDRGQFAQASGYHFVERREVLCLAEGQTAVDLDQRIEPGAADQNGGNGGNASTGILRELPLAVKAPAHHFPEVAAPETRLELQVFGRLAVEDFLQQIDRGLT